MQNSPTKGEKKRTEIKGLFSLLTNLWVAITIFMLDLARALKIQRIFEPRKTSFSPVIFTQKNLLALNDYNTERKKTVKNKVNLKIITGTLLTLIIILALSTGTALAAPADPGHEAIEISSGIFESGNYTFPDSLFIKEYFNVSDLLWVDPVTSRVGIGTTTPGAKLNIIEAQNADYVRMGPADLSHYFSVKSWASGNNVNVDVAGTEANLYIGRDMTGGGVIHIGDSGTAVGLVIPVNGHANAGNVGIGTTSPGGAKLNVTGTVDAWQVTVNGTAVLTSASGGNMSMWLISADSGTSPVGNNDAVKISGDGSTIQTSQSTPNTVVVAVGIDSINGAQLADSIDLDADMAFETDHLFIGKDGGSFDGRVGIGTTAPTHKLNVDGTVNITGGAIRGGIEVDGNGNIIFRLG